MNEKKSPPPGKRFSSTNQPQRRRGPSITNALKRKLKGTDKVSGKPMVEAVADSIITLARCGHGQALKELLARIDGVLPSELRAEVGPPPTIIFRNSVPDEDDGIEAAIPVTGTAQTVGPFSLSDTKGTKGDHE